MSRPYPRLNFSEPDHFHIEVHWGAFSVNRSAPSLRLALEVIRPLGAGPVEHDPVGLAPQVFEERLEGLEGDEGLITWHGRVVRGSSVKHGLAARNTLDEPLEAERIERPTRGIDAGPIGAGQILDRELLLLTPGDFSQYTFRFPDPCGVD